MKKNSIRLACMVVNEVNEGLPEWLNKVMFKLEDPRFYLDGSMLVAVENGNNPFSPATVICELVRDVLSIDDEIVSNPPPVDDGDDPIDPSDQYVIDPCMEEEDSPIHHFHIAQIDKRQGEIIFDHVYQDGAHFRIVDLDATSDLFQPWR